MEALIDAFGIDGRLIVVQLVNFAILAALLWYFLYKPVLGIITSRRERIAAGLADAEAAQKARENAEKERTAVVTGAYKEAEATVTRAQAYARQEEQRIVAGAEAKAAQILATAQVKAQAAHSAALKESEADIARVAVLAAEKILRGRAG